MPSYCTAFNCNNRQGLSTRLRKITFHSVPKDKELQLKWAQAIRRSNIDGTLFVPGGNHHLCSLHFTPADFDRTGQTTRLRLGSVPSIFDFTHSKPAKGPDKKSHKPVNKEEKVCKYQRKRCFPEIQDQTSTVEEDAPRLKCTRFGTKAQSRRVENKCSTAATQTATPVIFQVELLSLAAENEQLKATIDERDRTISRLRFQLQKNERKVSDLKKEKLRLSQFNIEAVLCKEAQHPRLFQYYTGLTYVRFMALLEFLCPPNFTLNFGTGRPDALRLSNQNSFFFTLCRLRHDFGLKDMAVRFGLKLPSANTVFDTWLSHMYLKLGQIAIWPHRDTILENMPKRFTKYFPCTIAIIDSVEFKTEAPDSLSVANGSKPNTTLKALIGCEPNGSLLFVSQLFAESLSNKELASRSGFYELLEGLKTNGYVKDGDAIMAGEGFTIDEELKGLGLSLKSSRVYTSGTQFQVTQIIARHRVHIHKLIKKVKTYSILKNVIANPLLEKINHIWSVCCLLTLFQDTAITNK